MPPRPSSPTARSPPTSPATAAGGYTTTPPRPSSPTASSGGDSAGSSGQEFTNYHLCSPTVTYSIVEGGYSGVGNLSADPLFVSSTDLRLQSGSPAIDVGDDTAVPAGVTTDLDGNPRFACGDLSSDAGVDAGVDGGRDRVRRGYGRIRVPAVGLLERSAGRTRRTCPTGLKCFTALPVSVTSRFFNPLHSFATYPCLPSHRSAHHGLLGRRRLRRGRRGHSGRHDHLERHPPAP